MRTARLIALTIAILGINIQSSTAQPKEPGGTADASLLALANPDEFAWQLFLYLNHQAKSGTAGEADASKPSVRDYDPGHAVVWETWGLASGLDLDFSGRVPTILRNVSEVFKNPAVEPVPWERLDRTPTQPKVLSQDLKRVGIAMGQLGQLAGRSPRPRSTDITILVAPSGSDPGSDETRMNKSTYETVRSKRLWSVEGVEAAFASALARGDRFAVRFEPMSKEVKARWIPLLACNSDANCADKGRYHWRTVRNPDTGQLEVWGLAAFHIITRDLPNWFWSDFGHIDCETGAGACAGQQGTPAETPLVDSTTRSPGGGAGPSGSNGVRTETVGSKWENYRLRGTQIEYVRTDGRATILSNPLIEEQDEKSSCITCHSYASVGTQVLNSGTSLPLFAGKTAVRNIGANFEAGPPKCQRFFRSGGGVTGECPDIFKSDRQLYLQTDFLWSIPFRAFSEKP
jgi:hypothetical protein